MVVRTFSWRNLQLQTRPRRLSSSGLTHHNGPARQYCTHYRANAQAKAGILAHSLQDYSTHAYP